MVGGLINLGTIHSQLGLELGSAAMADQVYQSNSSVDYSGSSADEANSCLVENNSMWDEWTHGPGSNVGDEVSTSNFQLPDLTTMPSSSSPRLSSFHQTDLLTSSWMFSSFNPLSLAHPSTTSVDSDPHPALFMHGEASLPAPSLDHHVPHSLATDTTCPRITSICAGHAHPGSEVPTYCPAEDHVDDSPTGPKASYTVSRHVLQALDPQSPSSPLAIQNGMLNPLGDPWDHGSSSCPATATGSLDLPSWANAGTQEVYYYRPSGSTKSHDVVISDHPPTAIDHLEESGSAWCTRTSVVSSRPRHTDIFIGPNGTFEAISPPGGWTPQFYDHASAETTTTMSRSMKMMASLRDAGESSTSGMDHSHCVVALDQNQTVSLNLSDCRQEDQNVWLGKHRLELLVHGDDHPGALQLKRAKHSVGQEMRGSDEMLRTYNNNCSTSGSLASQAMDMMIGPALNTNGKPRARRGSATDPQSVYARQRRERINDRLKTLQHLVPNGAKVDIVTMLYEAYDYVKFLQYQVTLLKSDELWVHATPYNYNGMDISNLPSPQTQELESSA